MVLGMPTAAPGSGGRGGRADERIRDDDGGERPVPSVRSKKTKKNQRTIEWKRHKRWESSSRLAPTTDVGERLQRLRITSSTNYLWSLKAVCQSLYPLICFPNKNYLLLPPTESAHDLMSFLLKTQFNLTMNCCLFVCITPFSSRGTLNSLSTQ